MSFFSKSESSKQNISSLPWKENFSFFVNLCLEVDAFNKDDFDKNKAAFYIEQLEKYLRNPQRPLASSAVAITALTMLYELTDAPADKVQVCKNQLDFTFELATNNHFDLIWQLTNLFAKRQGNFIQYVEAGCDSEMRRWGTLAQIAPTQKNNFNFLLNSVRTIFSDSGPLKSAIEIGNLWPGLSDKERTTALSAFFEYIGRPRVDIGYRIGVAKVIADNFNDLNPADRSAVFERSLECLKTQPEVAIELLTFIWSSLSEREQGRASNAMRVYLSDDQKKLCRAAPLMWAVLSDSEKQNRFDQLLALLANPRIKASLNIGVTALLRLEPQLTDGQKRKVLDSLASVYKHIVFPAIPRLSEAIWLYSKGDGSSVDLNFRSMTSPGHEFNKTKKTLVEQLKYLGLNRIRAFETQYEYAKKTIDLCCQRCPDLNALRKLKDEFERARNELAFLSQRRPDPLLGFITLSLRRHQWQGINPKSQKMETYECSQEWTECMQIFKTHMSKYQEQLTSEDQKFLGQAGSGWLDHTI